MERLYLAANNITQRSTAVLKDFLHNADGLRTLDISSNSLDDSSSFSLLSSLETSSQLVTFFLADNLIRNPPALIERLRRLNRWKVLLDETLEDSNAKTKKPAMRIHLPFLCFQRPVKSDLPITAPRSQSPASALEAPANLSIAASVEVDNAIQSLKSMLPELPSHLKDVDQSSTASFLDKINNFIKTVDVSAPISQASQAAPMPVMQAATPKPALQASPPMPAQAAMQRPQAIRMPFSQPHAMAGPPQVPLQAMGTQHVPQTMPGTTAKASFGSNLMRPPAPPTPPTPLQHLQHLQPTAPVMPTLGMNDMAPTKAAVMAQYEAALLGADDGDTAQAAPWKSQRKRTRRTSTENRL